MTHPIAYYNEIDEFAAQWLRNLIAAGHIAPGVVDTRSIEDVRPSDLAGFTQCHFFAGIGIWSLALRNAGWPDARPVWTGSCPCQPFSTAGKGAGFDDERHLWPAWFHLIKQCHPPSVLGEQVASKDTGPWLDLVQTDLEIMGYAFGAVPFPAAGVGAPHIRDRLYWVAHSSSAGLEGGAARAVGRQREAVERGGCAGGLADDNCIVGDQGGALVRGGDHRGDAQQGRGLGSDGVDGGVANADGRDTSAERQQRGGEQRLQPQGGGGGWWSDAEWIPCRDGKWRPVEPGSFPLAHGLPAGLGRLSAGQRGLADLAGADGASLKRAKAYRVGSLRGYGNAIVAPAAETWVRCVMECMPSA
jgi:DNA (cytosine-5)-methyltransferase 1